MQNCARNPEQYPRLFQSGNIGALKLDNRIIMAAMGNALADSNGNVTEAMLEYYGVRARGGVGMVITQFASVSPSDIMPYNLRLDDDKYVIELKKLVDVIHKQSAQACIQLMHPGMLLLLIKPLAQGVTIKVPGLTPRLPKDKPFQVITPDDIENYIRDFAAAAGRARDSGADAVELHACHGCLLATFLSPAINQRSDSYGGSVENRARFVRRIVEQTKDKVGAGFPLMVRINGDDDVEGGVTPSEVVETARILSAAGADAIHISSGLEYWSTLMAPSYLTPEGIVIPVAAEVKKAVRVPVIVAGKVSPILAEKTISSGRADFVALGRPLLADPGLPNKLRHVNSEEIVQCIYCNNCLRTSWRSCTVNPFLFRESTARLTPAAAAKKILVVGGGLAGMEAAVLCKKRGHEVSLFEREPELGGQWNIAAALPGKQGYAAFTAYLKNSLKSLQIPVRSGSEIDREGVIAIKPDIAIIATGAVPVGLDIPGAAADNVVQANDVIRGRAEARGKTVVIGGSMLAMEVAAWLAEQNREVALVSHSGLGGRKGPDDMITFRGLMRRLIRLRVPLYLNAAIMEVAGSSLVIGLGEEIISLPSDTVILAIGVKPLDRLAGELKGIVPEVYSIGDCVMPGNAAQATYSAARLALKL